MSTLEDETRQLEDVQQQQQHISNGDNNGGPNNTNGAGDGTHAKVTPTLSSFSALAPTPVNLAPAPPPVASSAGIDAPNVAEATLPPSAEGLGSMDFTAMKDSMEHALASIATDPSAATTDTAGAGEGVALPQLSGDDKQAQLRAMYLAGFRAAAQARQQQSLRENFEKATGPPTSAAVPTATTANPLGSTSTTHSSAPSLTLASSAPTMSTGSNTLLAPAPPPPTSTSAAMVIPMDGSSIAAGVIRLRPSSASAGSSPSGLLGATLEQHKASRRVTRTQSSSLSNTSSPSVTSVTASSPGGGSSTLEGSGSGRATGHSNPFPRKLMEMLRKEDPAVVAWLPRGDSFSVRNADKFIADVLPRYFRHSKLTSFQRQLNLYGFRRITKGPDAGAYRHELFHRDHPDRCMQMKRSKQKGSASPLLKGRDRSNSMSSQPSPLPSPEQSPSFHGMEGGTALLSCSAPSVMVGRPQLSPAAEQHQAHFRDQSPPTTLLQTTVHTAPPTVAGQQPQTGLGILMNSTSAFYKPPAISYAHLTPEQQQDIADREKQASSLAEAGLVADAVSHLPHPGAPDATTAAAPTMEGTNWGLMDTDLGDMEMDFAKMFDQAVELESMAAGEGWPATNNGEATSAPMPSNPPPDASQSFHP